MWVGLPKRETVQLKPEHVVQGGLPYATVNLGPLLFALPLEKAESEWRYALVQHQTLTLKRNAMPAQWNWPEAPPLTISAKVRKISNFEDVCVDVANAPGTGTVLVPPPPVSKHTP